MIDIALFKQGTINTEIELALQELDILFNTNNTEMIGYPEYGTNFLQFLWALSPNINILEQYIDEKIQTQTYYLRNTHYYIDVSYVTAVNENVYVVSISVVDDSGEKHQRLFNIK